MSHYNDKSLATALAELNYLLSCGYEYPDAEFKAARKNSVDLDVLRAAYDKQFSEER